MEGRQGVQKRKRPPISGEEDLETRIGGKIHHEKKEVRKASKKTKTFETQKVVKRLKDLRTKSADHSAINKFEAELVSLKIVNCDAIGDSAFKSKILKDSTLRHHKTVVAIAKQELELHPLVPAEPGTAAARIQNRLLSSKILSAQVAASISSLKILLDPDAKRRKVELSRVESDTLPLNKAKDIATRVDEDDLESELGADNASWSSGTIGDDEIGGESSSGSSPDSPDSPRQPIDESDSDEWDGQDDDGPLTGNNPRDAQSANAADKKSTSISQSTFLPSLSVGFVKGSDDSVDEGDGRAADMPRKNRRGQRARRLIWEKKYGRNANHKKKEALERAAFLAKKMLKTTKKLHLATGANVIKPTTNNFIPHRWPSNAQGAYGHVEVSSSHDSKRDAGVKDVKLHPSWEAKRKLKEKDRAAIVPSQGKKIMF